MGKLLCILRRRDVPMSNEEVRSRIHEIYGLCSTSTATERNRRGRPTKALRGIIEILRRGTRSQLQLVGPREIVFIAAKIVFHFEEVRERSAGKCDWKRRRDCRIARAYYHDILGSFVPEKSRDLVYSLVEVICREKLWRWEDLCWSLARDLLRHGVGGAPIVEELLDRLETTEATRVQDARAILRILCQMLDLYSWPNSEDTVLALERLLKLYYGSLSGVNARGVAPYGALKRGLELCVRHAIDHLEKDQLMVAVYHMCAWAVDEKTSDSTILDFGSTLEYAAYMHVSGLYKDALNARVFAVLMRMLSSSSRLVSLLGNRVLQHLLDRRDNRSQFDTPKIFFEGTRFDLKLNQYSKEDKRFLQDNRQLLHDCLVNSVMNHHSVRINLESTYCTICLIAVEVPCGFTAAALVCLAMNLQEMTLEQSGMYREASYHVHATVIAIMSLLCWIHGAKVFYSYVNKIMTERAQWAPHLNPPLKARYSFAIHHVLWDKPELFFVDWEARYGLWKCFRLRESQRRSTDESAKRVKMSSA